MLSKRHFVFLVIIMSLVPLAFFAVAILLAVFE